MTIKSLALFTLAAFALSVHVTDSFSQDKERTRETAVKYKAMIDQLASPNAKPKTHINGKPYRVRFPTDYDVELQELVDEARRSLNRYIEKALPYLIDALDDKRSSKEQKKMTG